MTLVALPCAQPQVLKCPFKSKPEENKEKEHLQYSSTVDSWAVGVLTYELLVGCPPFYDQSRTGTENRIKSGAPAFPSMMSEAAKDFVMSGEQGGMSPAMAMAQQCDYQNTWMSALILHWRPWHCDVLGSELGAGAHAQYMLGAIMSSPHVSHSS